MGPKQFRIWQLPLWLAANSETMAWTFSKAYGHILSHRKYVIPPKLQAFNYRKASPFPNSIMDLQSGRLCLCCFPYAYLTCIAVFLSSTTHNHPVRTVNLVTGRWKTLRFCSEQQQCCFILYACAFFSFSSSLKLLVLSTGSLSLSFKPFLYYRFAKELLLSSLQSKEANIPRFPHCCPHFHSVFNLLLGNAKREMSCTHLCWGPEGLRLCTRLDVMCVKLLFSGYQIPSWTPASCATILTGQCTDRSSKSCMWQRK